MNLFHSVLDYKKINIKISRHFNESTVRRRKKEKRERLKKKKKTKRTERPECGRQEARRRERKTDRIAGYYYNCYLLN